MSGTTALIRPCSPFKRGLLGGTSRAALARTLALGSLALMAGMVPSGPAAAQSLSSVRGQGKAMAAALPAGAGSSAVLTGAQQNAMLRQIQIQGRVGASADLARQAQAAARAAAIAAGSGIPDGIATGGLMPVTDKRRNNDPTNLEGLLTWDGAAEQVKSSTSDGKTTVTVDQTQSRAVLSWNSFNVGSNTTLVFDQKGNSDWSVLNRVVGSTAPSTIAGSIKADGLVMILNQNGVLFTGSSQVNTRSLVASTLEIGARTKTVNNVQVQRTLVERSQEFLDGMTRLQLETAPTTRTGTVEVAAGARLTSTGDGYLVLSGMTVKNAGSLSAANGDIGLLAGTAYIGVNKSDTNEANPNDIKLSSTESQNFHGLTFRAASTNTSTTGLGGVATNTGLIESARGSIQMLAGKANYNTRTGQLDQEAGVVVNNGVLLSSTSVSRNGAIKLSAPIVSLLSNSVISILPDSSPTALPTDSTSLANFRPSFIQIDGTPTTTGVDKTTVGVEIAGGSLIYAPSADIRIGFNTTTGGASTDAFDTVSQSAISGGQVLIDSGAVIDASGLKDVTIPASRNLIKISPVTGNDLANTPNYRDGSVLKGATVYVDPRLSGVRADGTRWVGSPLIDAAAYAEQVGATAAELMTSGGTITIAGGTVPTSGSRPANGLTPGPGVVIKQGASLDVSGGWTRFEGGPVRTTKLIAADGSIVDIGSADPNVQYVGIYTGTTVTQPRWGVSTTYGDPLSNIYRQTSPYALGADAGAVLIYGSSQVLDGTLYGEAYAGRIQASLGKEGTARSGLTGDRRHMQGSSDELPADALLVINDLGRGSGTGNPYPGGGDVEIVAAGAYGALAGDLPLLQTVSMDAATGTVTLTAPTRNAEQQAALDARLRVVTLSDSMLTGLGQVSVTTNGTFTIADGAHVRLGYGGILDVLAGQTITIAKGAAITAPSGEILLKTARLGTYYTAVNDTPLAGNAIGATGSIFEPLRNPTRGNLPMAGDYDVIVDGALSVAGRWVNLLRDRSNEDVTGGAYLDGGSITITAAANVVAPKAGTEAATVGLSRTGEYVDVSGSVLVNETALLDLSAGGRVLADAGFDLSGRGGNLSLSADTAYFTGATSQGARTSQTSTGVATGPDDGNLPRNPDKVRARVLIAPAARIRSDGFAGGGSFSLVTPEFSFGDGVAAQTGTQLPLDFLATHGFATYTITSNKTALFANTLNNLGGYHAMLATQTLEIGEGQTLRLTHTALPGAALLTADQATALRDLASGGNVYSVLTAAIPTDAYDRESTSLALGGSLELVVSSGGAILGDAGSRLTVGRLLNAGSIVIHGGTITQSASLFSYGTLDTLDARLIRGIQVEGQDITRLLNLDAGCITSNRCETRTNTGGVLIKVTGANSFRLATNAEIFGTNNTMETGYYLLGELGAMDGIVLAAGSTTDLSGISLHNPRAFGLKNGVYSALTQGRIYAGGTLEAAAPVVGQTLGGTGRGFHITIEGTRTADDGTVQSGAVLDLRGSSDRYDQLGRGSGLVQRSAYELSPVWSNGGTLSAYGGLDLGNGARISAGGGGGGASGGSLLVRDPTLSQSTGPLAADAITAAGFVNFTAVGTLTATGNVQLSLPGRFTLTGITAADVNYPAGGINSWLRAGDGTLRIDAAYVRLESAAQTASSATLGGSGSITLHGGLVDVAGGIRATGNLALISDGDLRLIGAPYSVQIRSLGTDGVLGGTLSVTGDLNLSAAQIYATTGTSFNLSAPGRTITLGRTTAVLPATPYSAGSSLTLTAKDIVQGGVLRAPLGSLTFNATGAVTLRDGSQTSVSANGLKIPYGTTTDGVEWYFTPTGGSALVAPPEKRLTINGSTVDIQTGATVDISGGGDVYAYEFVPGNTGTRDVLDRYNADRYSSGNGYLYPDGRQVYAIVPGLSDAAVAGAYDPIYSADYANLYSGSLVGQRVYLSDVPGLAAGWYTLLPAKYAMLPGGVRVVERTELAGKIAPDFHSGSLDGTVTVAGQLGTLTGTDHTLRAFDVQSQDVFLKYSKIVLTTGNDYFAKQAAHNSTTVPQLARDAGRLILAPTRSLTVNGNMLTAAAEGGRGSQVDLSAAVIDIVSTLPATPASDRLVLTAGTLSALKADSLLIGGTRVEQSDGSTLLGASRTTRPSNSAAPPVEIYTPVIASRITIANDAAHVLTAGEVLLLASGSITLADGAAIAATGTLADSRTTNYVVGRAADSANAAIAGTGALVRIANGPERLLARNGTVAGTAMLSVGAASLAGQSLLLDSSGGFSLSSDVRLSEVKSVALGADRITLGASASTGIVLTPALQATLTGRALTLNARSSIDLASGSYSFGTLRLDAPTLRSLDGGSVSISADRLTLGNVNSAAAVCSADCGSGQLALTAKEIVVGPGMVTQAGFGGGLDLSASAGLFTRGSGGLAAGLADLRLHTPYLGDRDEQTAAGADVAPQASLTSLAALSIDTAGAGSITLPAGLSGSSLALSGASVDISGSRVRATAGKLDIKATRGDIRIGDGAVVETPGFTARFGASDDQVNATAPGGSLSLTAVTGTIRLGSSGTLSVGGSSGAGGSLSLSAGGSVALDGRIDGKAPEGGARLAIDSGAALDVSALVRSGTAAGFDKSISLRSGSGDLVLEAGQSVKTGSLSLTADGGAIRIAGTIDTSGINGGDVSLYGRSGVTLDSTAIIDASAKGYGSDTVGRNDDSRSASGGTVTLGTDFLAGSTSTDADGAISGRSGAIRIDSGAVIDVSARRPGDRLVRIVRAGVVNYQVVTGDRGGSVHLRTPVIGSAGSGSVNVAVADAVGSIRGAASVVLEGYRRWDLAQVAASGTYTGVTISNGTASLNPATGQDGLRYSDSTGFSYDVRGGLNFLADRDASGRHETMVSFVQDFDVSGSIGSLARLTNFTAAPGVELSYSGSISLDAPWNLAAGAVDYAAGVADGSITRLADGTHVAVSGREGDIFSRHTGLLYRVDGTVGGAAGILALRAGGDVNINKAVNDGFFTFADGENLTYLRGQTGNRIIPLTGTTLVLVNNDSANPPAIYNPVRLTADANAVSPTDSARPFNAAQLFPSLGDGSAADSWSYRLVAGASDSTAPDRTLPVSTGRLMISGATSGTVTTPAASFTGDVLFDTTSATGLPTGGLALNAWAAWYAATYGTNARVALNYNGNQLSATERAAYTNAYAAYGLNFTITQVGNVPIGILAGLLTRTDLTSNGVSLLSRVNWSISGTTNYYTAQTFVRTGTGTIRLGAAGNVQLYDPSTALPTFREGSNTRTLGGSAVYTAGRQLTSLPARTLSDPLTGAVVNLPAFRLTPAAGSYYLTDGGDIRVTAGGDVLSVRVNSQSSTYGLGGSAYQTTQGTIQAGAVVNATCTSLACALMGFPEGFGALGGGDISVVANGNISDVTLVAAASTVKSSAGSTNLLYLFGGGDVTASAGKSLLGNRVDVASGRADLSALGNVATASATGSAFPPVTNGLRLRLYDADVTVSAGGSLFLSEVATYTASDNNNTENLDFTYAPGASLDLRANGDVAYQAYESESSKTYDLLPGSLSVLSVTGDVDLYSMPEAGRTRHLTLYPDATGQLQVLAGGNIGAVVINMEDSDPGYLPGLFSNVLFSNASSNPTPNGRQWGLPYILPGQSEAQKRYNHSEFLLTNRDNSPVRMAAGGDISNLSLFLPKQARISAGNDIVNMVFIGQNLGADDISRITAGRDITASSVLARRSPYGLVNSNGAVVTGDYRPTVAGNLFMIGGSGALFLEAGRDLGPFASSAEIGLFLSNGSGNSWSTSNMNLGGGILSVGAEMNPYLQSLVAAAGGTDLYTFFGVGNGADWSALRETYLNPANLDKLEDDLFEQKRTVRTVAGFTVEETEVFRDKPLYAPILIAWMQAEHPEALAAKGVAAGQSPSFQQAYEAFTSLDVLTQRRFLIDKVYFNELGAAADPKGNSYLQYSRGYTAVNLLFPASLGYTQNGLSGGLGAVGETKSTGDLDLRLATIQTGWGGDIRILGPGGRILAGSTVRTDQQIQRRNSALTNLLLGRPRTDDFISGIPGQNTVYTSTIISIPSGLEGILSLRGGSIYSFTDGSLVLNQSRLFTQAGDNIILWSSNGDLNAGQGPKTSANYPPVTITTQPGPVYLVDAQAGTSGAGIGAFDPDTEDDQVPSVALLAPRGTVDAGDAGVRVRGTLSIAAAAVANAANFDVSGPSFGMVAQGGISNSVQVQSLGATAAVDAAVKELTSRDRPTTRTELLLELVDDPKDDKDSTLQ
ncbi:filamentous haemagglutinin family protein [Oleisolibacter albus]|uniref:filamentous haemagglutinin family protein n=1 Tax=Oleisolibacter albus TaxID=2171757 RepID=UPI000DF37DD2|nr:filamentous haemagglutinin family protein [Oleisolibacter albus]